MMLSFDVIFKCILCCGVVFVKGREETIVRDFDTNVTLPCYNAHNAVIRWEKQGKISKKILPNGDLFLDNVQKNDSGLYQCSTATEDELLSRIHLIINAPPAALKNITVIPSTVYALIRWQSEDNDDSNINITVGYKEVNSVEWHYSHRVQPLNGKVEVFELEPNSSYLFQIWASNKLGRGEITNVTANTLHDEREIELARHLLRGVKTFDTRTWLIAVAIMIATLFTLVMGITLVTCCDWHHFQIERQKSDPERIELIPNIIVNPGCGTDDTLSFSQLKTSLSSDEDDEVMTSVYFACRNGARTINV